MTKEQSIREYYFRVNKSIEYIKSNLNREISLENLAAISNFSKYHYLQIFKSVAGISLPEFIEKVGILYQ